MSGFYPVSVRGVVIYLARQKMDILKFIYFFGCWKKKKNRSDKKKKQNNLEKLNTRRENSSRNSTTKILNDLEQKAPTHKLEDWSVGLSS